MPLRIVSTNLAATAASLVASSTAGSLAASNLLTLRKAQVWRATGTSASLTLTWSAAVTCSLVTLPFCNFTAAATLRVRAYTLAADVTPALDTTAQPCCTSDAGGWPAYAVAWFAATSCEKLVIDIADGTNPAGYVQAGALIVGDYWQPDHGPALGATQGLVDDTRITRTDGGDPLAQAGARRRSLAIQLEAIPEADRAQLYAMRARCGVASPVFVSVFAGEGHSPREHAHQMWALFASSFDLGLPYFQLYGAELAFEEI